MPEPSIVYVNGTCLNSGFVGAVAGIGIYFENHALRPYDLSEEMPFHVIRRNGGGLNQDMAELYVSSIDDCCLLRPESWAELRYLSLSRLVTSEGRPSRHPASPRRRTRHLRHPDPVHVRC